MIEKLRILFRRVCRLDCSLTVTMFYHADETQINEAEAVSHHATDKGKESSCDETAS
jgi:hypothetical protein